MLSDDVEVGVSDPCNIFGSQTLILINGGYISAVTGVFVFVFVKDYCPSFNFFPFSSPALRCARSILSSVVP
jgi:hypothetical protein